MLKRLLTPPDLPDPEERRQAAAIIGILVPAAVVVAVLAATTPLLSDIIYPTLPLRLGLLALIVGGVWLAHRGRPRLVIGIVIPGMWIVVTVMAAVTGGNRSPAVVGYFLLLMAAGYLWGRRGALSFSLSSSAPASSPASPCPCPPGDSGRPLPQACS